MDAGWIVSLIVVGIWMVIILGIMIPLERKHIVRKNGKIDYHKTTIFLRWNVFDTLTLALVVYTIICVQALNLLISLGQTVDNVYVQFFTNQSQAWTIVAFIYLLMRLSNTLKSIRARYGGTLE
ncbi:group-specific protein [Halobacillus sp. HZG1]|uniref:group-specific protein n=1 Tax=Halobacillus sp. HZG1 TaxID=3111769 RepID=UPI002DB5B2DA|nr:group-specific protein [Halobacillus sp. HZG1]MEC3885139.1 group-specific protein [Halobacillus sp. HZG1]